MLIQAFNCWTRVEPTGEELICPGGDYDEECDEFRVCEDVLHSRRPFHVPAIYESENTWKSDNIVEYIIYTWKIMISIQVSKYICLIY